MTWTEYSLREVFQTAAKGTELRSQTLGKNVRTSSGVKSWYERRRGIGETCRSRRASPSLSGVIDFAQLERETGRRSRRMDQRLRERGAVVQGRGGQGRTQRSSRQEGGGREDSNSSARAKELQAQTERARVRGRQQTLQNGPNRQVFRGIVRRQKLDTT